MIVPVPGGGSMVRPIPKSIAFAAVREWCRHFGIQGAEFDDFLRLIDDMDDAWREVVAEQAAAATPT